jgi:hypothetical protein
MARGFCFHTGQLLRRMTVLGYCFRTGRLRHPMMARGFCFRMGQLLRLTMAQDCWLNLNLDQTISGSLARHSVPEAR